MSSGTKMILQQQQGCVNRKPSLPAGCEHNLGLPSSTTVPRQLLRNTVRNLSKGGGCALVVAAEQRFSMLGEQLRSMALWF